MLSANVPRLMALVLLSASVSLASPMVSKPSFERLARNMLPFRCDVRPGNHEGLVDGIKCSWDWWAHGVQDFHPQPTDQWSSAKSEPTTESSTSCTCSLAAQATACTACHSASPAPSIGPISSPDPSPWQSPPKSCNEPFGLCTGSEGNALKARDDHEWEHFNTVEALDTYMAEHPGHELVACSEKLDNLFCYFRTEDDHDKRALIQTPPQPLPASLQKRTFGCRQTHDSRCDYFDDGLIKHAICVFYTAADRLDYITAHPDFKRAPALCNLLNSGPGLVCGFDLKGYLLAPQVSSPPDIAIPNPGNILPNNVLPGFRNIFQQPGKTTKSSLATSTTTRTTTRTSTLPSAKATVGISVGVNDDGLRVREIAAAAIDSTILVESVWPSQTVNRTTTTTKTLKKVIPQSTVTGTAVVDWQQTETSTTTTTVSPVPTREAPKTLTFFETVFETKHVPSSTSTVWTVVTNVTTATPGCSPVRCVDREDVRSCLEQSNQELSLCANQDHKCKCTAYDMRMDCFLACPKIEPEIVDTMRLEDYHCSRAYAFPTAASPEKAIAQPTSEACTSDSDSDSDSDDDVASGALATLSAHVLLSLVAAGFAAMLTLV